MCQIIETMEPRQHLMPTFPSPSLEGLCPPYGGLCHLLGKIMRDKQSQLSNRLTPHPSTRLIIRHFSYGATEEERLGKATASNLMVVRGRAYRSHLSSLAKQARASLRIY